MKSKFITDPRDPFGDGVFDPAGAGVSPNFFPAAFVPLAGHDGGSPSASASPVISPTPFPTVPAETVAAQSAQTGPGGPGSVVAETSGGITFNLQFDAAAMASTTAAANFRAGIEQAASMLSATITDKITVNIAIDYSGTGGGAAAGPDTGLFVDYSTVRAGLVNNATKGDPTFNALPTIQGQSQVAVWDAQLKLFGLALPSNYSGIDGSATFATDIQPNLLVGVALHELSHALGRVPYGSQPDIFDFYRFTSAGSQLFANGNTAPAAYFSVDGGLTKIADYGQTSDPSDFLNSGVQGGNDPFNEFYTNGTIQALTTYDKEQLDALGFHLASPLSTAIQTDTNSYGSTSLVRFFNNYYLQNASTGAGPELKTSGSAVVAQSGGWTPIGVAQTATGYEVAWKLTGTNEFSVWATDSNGNYTSNLIGVALGTDPALESIETSFHQDLNGDGTIGLVAQVSSVIESFGSTSLVQVGSNYFLNPVAGGTGPELKISGSDVVAGQSGGWTPIGAEQTATGYEVAWKLAGANEFSVWATDSNGNYTSNFIGVALGTDSALESIETSFHQDLNGDGIIGPVPSVIESFGSTSLVQVGSNYFLNPVAGGTGPELKISGAAVVAGQSGGWTPIGAEQTSTGYEVAWKLTGTNEFSVWATDSNGNYTSNLIGVALGTDSALESIETSFHQDLNGDGTIGPVATVIESFGSTSLVQVGSNYFLNPVAGGTGPELKINGAPVVAGQSGGWTPIGTEQTATGYEVAWKLTGTNEFSVWATDRNGNYTSNLIGVALGTDSALESIETSFHQDLNGDGTIGVPPATKPATSTTVPNVAVAQSPGNDTFLFRHDLGAKVVAANVIDPSFSASTNNQFTTASQDGLAGQIHNLFDAAHHDQALNASGAHDQFLQDTHLANLVASQFLVH